MNFIKMSFPLQMAVGIFVGICCGLFFGEDCKVLAPWMNSYIMILKITAIPYLTVAIIQGVALLTRTQAIQILKKGSIFITLALLINVGIIYLIKFAMPAAESKHLSGYVTRDAPDLHFAELLIPENIFYNLANNIVPAIVVFAVLMGLALMQLAEKQITLATLQTILEALTKVTSWISRITPFGTFLIIAYQSGTVQLATFKQMGTYFILFILGTSLVVFWIAPRMASILTPIKAGAWLRTLAPLLILGYTTNLVIVTLPYIINIIQKELQMLYPKDENVQNQIQGTVSVIFNLPLGSIFISAFVMFLSVFYSHNLSGRGQLEMFITSFIACLGGGGIGSAINSLTFILDTIGLPLDGINLYLAIVPFTAGFQTMVSVMLISTLAFIITLAGRGLLIWRWGKIALNTVLTAIPVILIFYGVKHYVPLPAIKNQSKSIYDLEIQSDIKIKVYMPGEIVPQRTDLLPDESSLNAIQRTKKLRVGFDPNSAPFCFYNRENKLVGYDVAMAYELAYNLGCEVLEFVPMHHALMANQLQVRMFDIGMSAISISEERLKNMCFSTPYLEAKIVFVTLERNRKKFANIEALKQKPSIRIAALVNTAYAGIAYEKFPGHEVVLIDNYENFARRNKPAADILILEEPEAIAWTVAHPQFTVVYPKPPLGRETIGYPIRQEDSVFLSYLNSWLALKESDGFRKRQYNLWILGQTQQATPPPPRWSILHDVIGWKHRSAASSFHT